MISRVVPSDSLRTHCDDSIGLGGTGPLKLKEKDKLATLLGMLLIIVGFLFVLGYQPIVFVYAGVIQLGTVLIILGIVLILAVRYRAL